MTARLSIERRLPQPCAECPWRLSNHCREHEHGFYDDDNRERLWAGLRSGEAPGMTCHPTDPDMAEFEGYEKTATRVVTYECAGAVVLIQRELAIIQNIAEGLGIVNREATKRTSTKLTDAYADFRPEGLTIVAAMNFGLRTVMESTPPFPVFGQPTQDFLDQPVAVNEGKLPWEGAAITLPQAQRHGVANA